MILTENLINLFNKTLNEDINLPKGTKSAKVVTHVDLDGLICGITMVKQLMKQGIPKNRIVVELAQYGDDKKEKDKHLSKFEGKKNQFVGVTDYSKFPKAKPFDLFNKLLNFKAKYYKDRIITFFDSEDRSNMSFEKFKKQLYSSFGGLIKQNQFTEKTIKDLYNAAVAYSKIEQRYLKTRHKIIERMNIQNIEDYSFPMVIPDFVDDHHSNENGSLSRGETGEIAVDSPSEAEHLAKKYAPGFWSDEDLKAVSMVDSAKYDASQLENTMFLDKHFKGNKAKNVATILACLYDELAKRDRQAARWVIKNSDASLGSAYLNTLRALGYNNKRVDYLNALKEGNVEKAKELLAKIPGELNKQYDRRGEPKEKVKDRKQWIEKNEKDLKNARTGYNISQDPTDTIHKGKLSQWRGIYTMFNGQDYDDQYSRYAASLYSVNGRRAPFTVRYWTDSFQVSKNSLYDGKVNFKVLQDEALPKLKNYLLNYRNIMMRKNAGPDGKAPLYPQMKPGRIDNIINTMKEQNGGHSTTIWNFGGFENIKPSGSEYGTFFDDLKTVNRAKALGKDPKEFVKNAYNRKEYIEREVNKKYDEMKDNALKYTMGLVMNGTLKHFPPKPEDMERLKTSNKKFEGPYQEKKKK